MDVEVSLEIEEESMHKETVKVAASMALVMLVALIGIITIYQLVKTVPYEPGYITDKENMYENDFFKLRFKCPEGYQMTLAGFSKNEVNQLLDSDWNEVRTYQELTAISETTDSSMSIIVTRGELDLGDPTGRTQIKKILREMTNSVSGNRYHWGEPYEDLLSSETYQVMDLDVISTEDLGRVYIYSRKEKGYTVCIIFQGENNYFGELFDGFLACE
ncbi:MAG: hypothetical protein K6G64_06275 [Eubacterium sp.]|nr:hypothetical protein [Eubacterium sp.]